MCSSISDSAGTDTFLLPPTAGASVHAAANAGLTRARVYVRQSAQGGLPVARQARGKSGRGRRRAHPRTAPGAPCFPARFTRTEPSPRTSSWRGCGADGRRRQRRLRSRVTSPRCGRPSEPSESRPSRPDTACGCSKGTSWTSGAWTRSQPSPGPATAWLGWQDLREAIALFRGEPLAEFRYHAFAAEESARLEALRLALEEERVELELQYGRYEEAVPELERLIAENPFREDLRAQLMLALYRAGRQADALQGLPGGTGRDGRRARHRPQPRAPAARAADPGAGPRARPLGWARAAAALRGGDEAGGHRHVPVQRCPRLGGRRGASGHRAARRVRGGDGRRFLPRCLRPGSRRRGGRGRDPARDRGTTLASPSASTRRRQFLPTAATRAPGIRGAAASVERGPPRADPPLAGHARPPAGDAVGRGRRGRSRLPPAARPDGGSARVPALRRGAGRRVPSAPKPRELHDQPSASADASRRPRAGDPGARRPAPPAADPDRLSDRHRRHGQDAAGAARRGRAPRRVSRRRLLRGACSAGGPRPRPADDRADPRRARPERRSPRRICCATGSCCSCSTTSSTSSRRRLSSVPSQAADRPRRCW